CRDLELFRRRQPEHRADCRQRDRLRRLEHRQPLRARRPQWRARLEHGDGRRLPRTGGLAIADLPGDGTRRGTGVAGRALEESPLDLRARGKSDANANANADTYADANPHVKCDTDANTNASANTDANARESGCAAGLV